MELVFEIGLLFAFLKNVDQGSGQDARLRKSAAGVCEHFEATRNAAMGLRPIFEMVSIWELTNALQQIHFGHHAVSNS